MAIDLNQPMNVGQAQQELQGRYSDYLKQKRQVQGVRDIASERFAGSFGPQGESGAIVNPADIFSSFGTFNNAVPNSAEQLATESSILQQIAALAQAQQPEAVKPPTVAEQIAARKAGGTIEIDPQTNQLKFVPGTGEQAITPETEAELLKLREQRLSAGLDVSDIDKQLGLTEKIGEDEVQGVQLIDKILSSSDYDLAGSSGRIKAGKLFNWGDTAKLRNELNQLNGILQLASAGKLKGQGQISEGERAILANAVSALGLSEKGVTDLSIGEMKTKLEEMRTALAKKSNDPTLIKKYAGGTVDSPTPGPSTEILSDDEIKGLL